MKNKVAFKLAASTLILALGTIGCKPTGGRIASASAKALKADEGAAKQYAAAQAAVQQGDLAGALGFAERAVELSPRDTGYRMLLADLYLKNGRFISAESAFSDVLTLDPGNPRASLSRSLALIAQGKIGEATIELDQLATTAAPADVGLAFALAGQPQRAIEMLEPAARAPGANGRVRQNLALAYALAGEWQKARNVAAQDLSPADLAERLQDWAAFASASAPQVQVASLLGVTPAADAGQPIRLALAPTAPEPQAYVAAEAPAPAPAPAPQQRVAMGGPDEPVQASEPQVRFAAAPAPAPVFVRAPVAVPAPVSIPAPAAPVVVAEAPAPIAPPAAEPPAVLSAEAPQQPVVPFTYDTPKVPAFAEAAKVEPTEVEVAFTAPSEKPRHKRIAGAQFAAAVKSLVEAPAPVVRAVAKVAPAPIRAFQPRVRKASAEKRGTGRYVVQIGAYRNAAQVEKAWAQVQRRYGFGNRAPVSTTVNIPGKGTFHRLAVSGFEAPADAARACQTVRAKGGACFVRATAGDAPVQWASRYARAHRA
jgi:Flp pilus assembly protein TadD